MDDKTIRRRSPHLTYIYGRGGASPAGGDARRRAQEAVDRRFRTLARRQPPRAQSRWKADHDGFRESRGGSEIPVPSRPEPRSRGLDRAELGSWRNRASRGGGRGGRNLQALDPRRPRPPGPARSPPDLQAIGP